MSGTSKSTGAASAAKNAGFGLGEKSLKNLEGVHPRMLRVVQRAIQITTVDFGIPSTGGVRTAAQQKVLFDAGKSKADGYRKVSAHQSGRAVDVYAYVDGKASWDKEHLTAVADAMFAAAKELGLGITWGKNYPIPDYPHFQMIVTRG